MEYFFITVIFLGFCVTIIALSTKRADVSRLAIKTLGKLPKVTSPQIEQKEPQE